MRYLNPIFLFLIIVGVSAIGLIPTLIRWVARPQEPALA